MATFSRKELLVFGWIRKNCNYNIPGDLARFIQAFSSDAIQWIIQGKKFQEMFQKENENGYKYSNPWIQIDPARVMVDGFQFILSVNSNSDRHQFSISIHQSSLTFDFICIKAIITFYGNICAKTSVQFVSYGRKSTMGLFAIWAKDIYDYNKFDTIFEIDVTEVKYNDIKINDSLTWKLSNYEIDKLYLKSFVAKNIGNWRIKCANYDGSIKDLMIQPLALPKDIGLMELEYTLVLRDDKNRVAHARKGDIYVGESGKYIDKWDHSVITYYCNFEIDLNIKIKEILSVDGVCDRNSWFEYGFI